MATLAPRADAVVVAYWGFEEGSGAATERTRTAGTSSDQINGIEITDYSWNGFGAPGVGGSNSLNSTGGVGRVASTYAGIGGSETRSVALWVRTTTTGGGQSFVTWGDSQGGNGRKWHVRMNDNVANGEINAVRTEIQGSFEIGSTPSATATRITWFPSTMPGELLVAGRFCTTSTACWWPTREMAPILSSSTQSFLVTEMPE